jgi:predicted nucleotidyltransferase
MLESFFEMTDIVPVDSNHSELERDKEKLEAYVALLEQALGHGIKVVGILEIGSFANGEGMEFSDIDTRVYVESPDTYIWNVDGHKSSELFYENKKAELGLFMAEYGKKPIQNFTWEEFNLPIWKKIRETLGIQVEFGLVDKRYVQFELDHLEEAPSNEHSFLMQSSIVYDPQQFLIKRRQLVEGLVISTMAQFYTDRFLNGLPSEIYDYTHISEEDLLDIRERHKIQWVKWAVRAVREAVATKTYIMNGYIVHQKNDVLAFYKKYLPQRYDFVAMLYDWKMNPEKRNTMIQECLENPEAVSHTFKGLMPEIEATVKDVHKLIL